MSTENQMDQELTAEGEVLNIITEISNSEPSYNPFDSVRSVSQSVGINTSISKSTEIIESSPEPDTTSKHIDKDVSSCNSQDNCLLTTYEKIKKRQTILITLSASISLAFVVTLVGIIILACTKSNEPQSYEDLSNALRLNVPVKRYEFRHVDGSSPKIAEAFADHSLYQTFHGVTYDDYQTDQSLIPDTLWYSRSEYTSEDTLYSNELQHNVTLDIALLSRVTSRIRLIHNENYLIDRVLQALDDLNFRMRLTLSVSAEHWDAERFDMLRIIRSYRQGFIENIEINAPSSTENLISFNIHDEVRKFLDEHNITDVKIFLNAEQSNQPNPLELTRNPKVATDWINSDHSRGFYTNLVTPSETSERARYTTSWVCGVAPHLRPDIEWYWSHAFDMKVPKVTSGIFTEDRKLKPAGLPRCNDY